MTTLTTAPVAPLLDLLFAVDKQAHPASDPRSRPIGMA
jgi:hypothetical protein